MPLPTVQAVDPERAAVGNYFFKEGFVFKYGRYRPTRLAQRNPIKRWAAEIIPDHSSVEET